MAKGTPPPRKDDETKLPQYIRKHTQKYYPKGVLKLTTSYHVVIGHKGFIHSSSKHKDLQLAVLRRNYLLQLLNLPIPDDFEITKGVGQYLGINLPSPNTTTPPVPSSIRSSKRTKSTPTTGTGPQTAESSTTPTTTSRPKKPPTRPSEAPKITVQSPTAATHPTPSNESAHRL